MSPRDVEKLLELLQALNSNFESMLGEQRLLREQLGRDPGTSDRGSAGGIPNKPKETIPAIAADPGLRPSKTNQFIREKR